MWRSSAMIMLAAFLVFVPHAVTSNVAPMPFRPGYGLGSIIPQSVMVEMEREAWAQTAILTSDQVLNQIESVNRDITTEINAVKNLFDEDNTVPNALLDAKGKPKAEVTAMQTTLEAKAKKAREAKLDAYESLVHLRSSQVESLFAAVKAGTKHKGVTPDLDMLPTSFVPQVESPIDWETSKIVYKDRASDSLNMDTRFFSFASTEDDSGAEANAKIVANAVKSGFNFGRLSAESSSQMGAQVERAFMATSKQSSIEYTLLVTSFATHRKVKQFEQVFTDVDMLRTAWNQDHAANATMMIPNPQTNMGVSATDQDSFIKFFFDNRNQTCNTKAGHPTFMLTEQYLGSFMVGMVHFIKQDRTATTKEDTMSKASIEASLKLGLWAGAFTGSANSENMKRLQRLNRRTDLGVVFNLVSLGYIPNIKSSKVAQAVESFADWDPAELSKRGALEGAGQNQQRSNTAAKINAVLNGLSDIEQTSSVLDKETFLNAFEDFAHNAKTMEGMGVPIGMGVKRFDLATILNDLVYAYATAEQKTMMGYGNTHPVSPPPPPSSVPSQGSPTRARK